MAEFQYHIITPEGKEKKGVMEGKTPEQLTALLKGQGNIVIKVDVAGALQKEINFTIGKKIKARDYCIFCRQIVSILAAGINIINALEMMRDATENKTLKVGLAGVHEGVSKGESLTLAMRKRKKVFPEMLCNMIEAGEASGSLEVAFSRMATQFEKEDRLKKSIRKATIYPAMLVILMIGILLLMLLWVIPTFMGMFDEVGADMNGYTMAIIKMSNFTQEYWYLLLIIVLVGVFAFRWFASTKAGKFALSDFILKVPVFGPLQIKTACARLGRTLSTLLSAGIPLVDAVDITGRSMENFRYKYAMQDARDQIMRGRALSQPLKGSGLFPVMVTHMVSIGEETGNIEEMLENVADYYEDDVQVATDAMMAMLEPAIIIIMSVVVGAMVIAILLPMMDLYNSI